MFDIISVIVCVNCVAESSHTKLKLFFTYSVLKICGKFLLLKSPIKLITCFHTISAGQGYPKGMMQNESDTVTDFAI